MSFAYTQRVLLAPDQVSEWRGWMIVVLIAVNYSNLEEVSYELCGIHVASCGYNSLSLYL